MFERVKFFPARVMGRLIRMLRVLLDFMLMVVEIFQLRYEWLKPRPGDIYIATTEKSGTTWTQMILYQLVTEGRGEFDHICQVSPAYEGLVFVPGAREILDALPSPRLFKTHLYYNELRPPHDAKVVYVTRDAADTIASLYHHHCLLTGTNVPVETSFWDSMWGPRTWFKHLESWWPHRKDPNVLHVRYEDLVRDREGQIRRIAAFCGIPINEERMGDILEKTGFAYMKQHDAKFDVRIPFYGAPGSRSNFIRKGRVGSGGEELTPAHRAQVQERVAKLREKLHIGADEL